MKTPQGKLKITIKTKEDYQFIVKQSNQNETINVQKINNSQSYLTGFYDIELLTLPRQYFKNIRINQNQLTQLQLPSTGLANILLPANGYGGVYLKDGDKLTEIYKFNGESNQYKLTLLPYFLCKIKKLKYILFIDLNLQRNISIQMKNLL